MPGNMRGDRMSKLTLAFRDYQIDVLEIVGDAFAPKVPGGSPARKKLLGLTGKVVPLTIRTENQVKEIVRGEIEAVDLYKYCLGTACEMGHVEGCPVPAIVKYQKALKGRVKKL